MSQAQGDAAEPVGQIGTAEAMDGIDAINAERAIVPDAPAQRRPADCPVEDWLAFLGHRWNALILWHLRGAGPMRHGELAACLPGIAPKVLATRLDGLAQRGLVDRTMLPTFPRGVAYALSPSGEALLQILDQIDVWSKRHAPVRPWAGWDAAELAAGDDARMSG